MKKSVIWMVMLSVLCGVSFADVRDGLVSYWSFEEGGGSIAGDSVGVFDGTLAATDALWVPGKIGGGLDCAGSGDTGGLPYDDGTGYVDIGQDEALMPAELSVQAWVNLDSYINWAGIIGNVYDTGSTEAGWALHTRSSSVDFYVAVADGGDSTLRTVSHSGAPLGQWVHFVGTYDGSQVKLYVNGAEPIVVDTPGGPIDYTTEATPISLRIGQYFDNNEEIAFDGQVDEVAIWNRALTADEVAMLYNNGDGYAPILQTPTPANGAELVPVTTNLSWTVPANIDISGYDVLFGTEPNQASPAYDMTSILDKKDVLTVDPSPGGDLISDTMYYWQVDVYEANEPGDDLFHEGTMWSFRTAPDIPVILTDPESLIMPAGSTAEFSITATNTEIFTWYKSEDAANDTVDDDTAAGEGATLTLENIQAGDEGYYYCVATNTAGEDVSMIASLQLAKLIHHWPLDNESTADIVGVLDGTVIGDPNWIAGINGGAIDFDPTNGTNDYVILGTADDLNFGSDLDFTVAFWVKTTGWDEDAGIISNKDWNLSANTGWGIFGGNSATGTLRCNFNGGANVSSYMGGAGNDQPVVSDGQWHHVCVTYDRDGMQTAYMDGEFRDADSIAGSTSTVDAGYPTVLGTDGAEGSVWPYWFNGAIDDLRIYNYTLTAIDVATLYTDLVDAVICPLGSQPAMDVNDDCRVDIGDIAMMAEAWLECGRIPVEACE